MVFYTKHVFKKKTVTGTMWSSTKSMLNNFAIDFWLSGTDENRDILDNQNEELSERHITSTNIKLPVFPCITFTLQSNVFFSSF